MHVCVSVSVSVCICVYVYVHIHVHVYVYVYVDVYVYINPSCHYCVNKGWIPTIATIIYSESPLNMEASMGRSWKDHGEKPNKIEVFSWDNTSRKVC